jgi:hypothetical protein
MSLFLFKTNITADYKQNVIYIDEKKYVECQLQDTDFV